MKEDQIAQLIRLAGRRAMPDPGQMSRTRAAAQLEWRRVIRRRRLHVMLRMAGIAALVAAAIGLGRWNRTAPRVQVATVETLAGGGIAISPQGGRQAPLQVGASLVAGDRVETFAQGGVSFRTGDEISVRVGRDTSAVFPRPDGLILERGAIYVDAGPRAPRFDVETPAGVIRHIGTQFEVRLDDRGVRVRVREGAVAVDGRRGRSTAGAGEALLLRAGRSVERVRVTTAGPEWDWVSELSPPFKLEGATIAAFLRWAAREQGRAWQYESPEMAVRYDAVVLHGSIDGLTPDEALQAVLLTCGLSVRLEAERLVIGPA